MFSCVSASPRPAARTRTRTRTRTRRLRGRLPASSASISSRLTQVRAPGSRPYAARLASFLFCSSILSPFMIIIVSASRHSSHARRASLFICHLVHLHLSAPPPAAIPQRASCHSAPLFHPPPHLAPSPGPLTCPAPGTAPGPAPSVARRCKTHRAVLPCTPRPLRSEPLSALCLRRAEFQVLKLNF